MRLPSHPFPNPKRRSKSEFTNIDANRSPATRMSRNEPGSRRIRMSKRLGVLVKLFQAGAVCAAMSLMGCATPEGQSALEGDAGLGAVDDSDSSDKVLGPSDIVGKVYVGYQGWFSATGDGSPRNKWGHWSKATAPAPNFQSFELWPDVREFTTTFQTGYSALGNGQPSKLFSSWTPNTTDTQMKWMQTYGIDGAAVQRFGSELSDTSVKAMRDGISTAVKKGAEAYGRKFYIMYDISGWTNFQQDIKSDWTNTIVNTLKLTTSPAYARHNGKPVVNIWGMGFTDRPGDAAQCLEVIAWFKAQGCYVIGGVPSSWATSSGDSKTGFSNVYAQFDMLSPWTVGRFGSIAGADSWKAKLTSDWATCQGRGQAYQPVVFPGFAWSNWQTGAVRNQIPRLHGDFMWRQFANIKQVGIPDAYVAMFDEFDEGTAISKAAEDASMVPSNQYFLTLDADGTRVSSDFYLRLVDDASKMLRGVTSLVWNHPTPHYVGLPACVSRGATAASGNILAGECLKSADGRFAAFMQMDGKFVVYQNGGVALWSSPTGGTGANRIAVQSDGNVVAYAPTGAKWSTGTSTRGSSILTMQNDGNLVLKTTAGVLTWSSGTCCH